MKQRSRISTKVKQQILMNKYCFKDTQISR